MLLRVWQLLTWKGSGSVSMRRESSPNDGGVKDSFIPWNQRLEENKVYYLLFEKLYWGEFGIDPQEHCIWEASFKDLAVLKIGKKGLKKAENGSRAWPALSEKYLSWWSSYSGIIKNPLPKDKVAWPSRATTLLTVTRRNINWHLEYQVGCLCLQE